MNPHTPTLVSVRIEVYSGCYLGRFARYDEHLESRDTHIILNNHAFYGPHFSLAFGKLSTDLLSSFFVFIFFLLTSLFRSSFLT